MSPATRGLLALLTAASWAWMVPATAEPLSGTLELAPLVPTLRSERPTLARTLNERGPLFPWLQMSQLRVGVDGVTPVVVLGGDCPLGARLGRTARLENRDEVDWQVRLGDAEPITLGPGGNVALEPGAQASTLIADVAGTWACTVTWGADADIVVPVRRAGPHRFEVTFGEVALAQPSVTAAGSAPLALPVSLWIGGRRVCAPDHSGDGCTWTTPLQRDDGTLTLAPLRLDAETLYGAPEGP